MQIWSWLLDKLKYVILQVNLSISYILSKCFFSQKLFPKSWLCPNNNHKIQQDILCVCPCDIMSTIPQWVMLHLSALANVCFDSAHLCDPWTITHFCYNHISSVSCKSLPFMQHIALGNPLLFSFIQDSSFDKVWQNDSGLWIKYLYFCLNNNWGQQLESRNVFQLHYHIKYLHSLFCY